jgi:hypothetical protein
MSRHTRASQRTFHYIDQYYKVRYNIHLTHVAIHVYMYVFYHPPSLSMGDTRLRLLLQWQQERLREDFRNLIFRGDEPDLKLLLRDTLKNKVKIHLSMLRSCVKNWIIRKTCYINVITP